MLVVQIQTVSGGDGDGAAGGKHGNGFCIAAVIAYVIQGSAATLVEVLPGFIVFMIVIPRPPAMQRQFKLGLKGFPRIGVLRQVLRQLQFVAELGPVPLQNLFVIVFVEACKDSGGDSAAHGLETA